MRRRPRLVTLLLSFPSVHLKSIDWGQGDCSYVRTVGFWPGIYLGTMQSSWTISVFYCKRSNQEAPAKEKKTAWNPSALANVYNWVQTLLSRQSFSDVCIRLFTIFCLFMTAYALYYTLVGSAALCSPALCASDFFRLIKTKKRAAARPTCKYRFAAPHSLHTCLPASLIEKTCEKSQFEKKSKKFYSFS